MEPTNIKLITEEINLGEYEVTVIVELITRKHSYTHCRNELYPLVKALISTFKALENETVIIQTESIGLANIIRLANVDTRTLSKMLYEAIRKNGITVAGVEVNG